MSDIKVGSRVRLKNPDNFLVEYSKRVKDRIAVVDKIQVFDWGNGHKQEFYWIIWQKRGNRGKEFRQRHELRDLEIAE